MARRSLAVARRGVAAQPRRAAPLNSAGDQQDDDDQQDEAGAAARVVAPSPAIRPGRQRAEQDQNQEDDRYGAKHRSVRLQPVLLLGTRCDNSRFRYARAQPKRLPGILIVGGSEALPVAYRPAIDMDEIGARVVSDATAAQTGRGRPEMRQAPPLAAQIDRHPMDVVAVAGDPVMAQVQLVVGGRRMAKQIAMVALVM